MKFTLWWSCKDDIERNFCNNKTAVWILSNISVSGWLVYFNIFKRHRVNVTKVQEAYYLDV